MRDRLKEQLNLFRHSGSIETKRLQIKAFDHPHGRDTLFLCAEDKETGQPVGGVSLHLEDHPYGPVAKTGYWVLEDQHGKGYAIEMLESVLFFAFETLDLVSVQTRTPEDNLASHYILQKAGFVKENNEIFEARRSA